MFADPNLPDWRERGRGIRLIPCRQTGVAVQKMVSDTYSQSEYMGSDTFSIVDALQIGQTVAR